jgi:hypothetical protein
MNPTPNFACVEGASVNQLSDVRETSSQHVPAPVAPSPLTTPSAISALQVHEDMRPFVRLFWANMDIDGSIEGPVASSLALIDTGADVTAVVTHKELERLGLVNDIRPLQPVSGGADKQHDRLTPAGGGTIAVEGTVVLQPLLRAQRRPVHSHGNPHNVNVLLPGIVALVVNQPLAGCEFIVGERTLQASTGREPGTHWKAPQVGAARR